MEASSKTEAALRAQLIELRRDLSTSQQEVEQTRLDLQQRQQLLKSAAGEQYKASPHSADCSLSADFSSFESQNETRIEEGRVVQKTCRFQCVGHCSNADAFLCQTVISLTYLMVRSCRRGKKRGACPQEAQRRE